MEPNEHEHGPDDERAADQRPDEGVDDDSIDAGLMAYFGRPGTARDDDGPTFPRVYGDYELLREIGRGAMGTVYLAEQVGLHRRVALKILQPAMSLRFDAVVRFRTEAASAARLHHPGLVQVYAFGQHDEDYHLAMELVAGSTLQEVIAELRAQGGEPDAAQIGRIVAAAARALGADSGGTGSTTDEVAEVMPWDRPYVEVACRLITQVADALQHVHDAGIVHRDVKPSNILVREDGAAVLTDFGLARVADQPSVTRSSAYLGTPMYSSPEQAGRKNSQVDHRTDIFSLGVVLYELLTLRHPFAAESTQEVLDKVVQHDPPDPRSLNREVPRDLVTILQKALQKDPRLRYANAAALAADLRAFLAAAPIAARRTPPSARLGRFVRRHRLVCAVATTVVACGAAFAAWWWTRPGWLVLVGGLDGVTVVVGDHEPRTTPIEEPVEVDPGTHLVALSADGEEYERIEVAVARHGHLTIDLGKYTPPPPELPPGLGNTSSEGADWQKRIDVLAGAAGIRVRKFCAATGPIDRELLRRALAAVEDLATEPGLAEQYALFLRARYEAMGCVQSLTAHLLHRSLDLLPRFVSPTEDPEKFDVLVEAFGMVAETVVRIDPFETAVREDLARWMGDLTKTKELIVLLQNAREAERNGRKGDLRKDVAEMGRLDPASGLTIQAAGLLERLVTAEDSDVDSALDEFLEPAGSFETYVAVEAKLVGRGGLEEEHVRDLGAVHRWWKEYERRRNDLPTMTASELEAVRAPDVDGLPRDLRARGEKLAEALREEAGAAQRLIEARALRGEIEEALRHRRLDVATARLGRLEGMASGLDIEGIGARVAQLARQEQQWRDAERVYSELCAGLTQGGEGIDSSHRELTREWQQIRSWLDRELTTAVDRRSLLERRCTLLLRMRDPQGVIGDAGELLRLASDGDTGERFRGHMFRGQANYALSNFELADADFTVAIELAEGADAARAHYWRAACRYARSRRDPTMRDTWSTSALQDLAPERCTLDLLDKHYLRAVLLLALGRHEEAVEPAEFAVREHERPGRMLSEDEVLAALRLGSGSLSVAVREFRRDAHYECGEAYRKCGRFEDAVGEQGEALRLDPGFALAYYARGACYGALELYEQAVDDFDRAIEHAGDNEAFAARARDIRRVFAGRAKGR